jgi:PIN domain nuclease of toxin-antitoxin system
VVADWCPGPFPEGRADARGAWLADMNSVPEIRVESISADIAVLAGGLPEPMHGDPADRIIVATTSTLGVPLVTGDRKLQTYQGIRTIW